MILGKSDSYFPLSAHGPLWWRLAVQARQSFQTNAFKRSTEVRANWLPGHAGRLTLISDKLCTGL